MAGQIKFLTCQRAKILILVHTYNGFCYKRNNLGNNNEKLNTQKFSITLEVSAGNIWSAGRTLSSPCVDDWDRDERN
jgi:hypothetical protein